MKTMTGLHRILELKKAGTFNGKPQWKVVSRWDDMPGVGTTIGWIRYVTGRFNRYAYQQSPNSYCLTQYDLAAITLWVIEAEVKQ